MNHVTSANKKYLSLQHVSTEFIWDVTWGGAFYNANHLLLIREERHDRQKKRDDVNDAKLKGLVRCIDATNRRLILQAKSTGDWLNVRGTTVTGTLLVATEFRDLLCAHYNVTPLSPQSNCDGCSTSFDLRHALSCRKRGLVIARHNEVHDELIYLDRRDLNSADVWWELLTHQGRIISEMEIRHGSDRL